MRRKGCPVTFDLKLWKVRRVVRGKKRRWRGGGGLGDRLGLLKSIYRWSFVMSLGYFDFEFAATDFFFFFFFFHPLFLPSLWTFQWQHYDDIWDTIARPLCVRSRIKAGPFLKRPPSHPLVSLFVSTPLRPPPTPHLNAAITWGDAALMLTPSKRRRRRGKAESSLYLSALKKSSQSFQHISLNHATQAIPLATQGRFTSLSTTCPALLWI